MIRATIEKEFKCSGCKNLPRPGQTSIKKCSTCSNVFCVTCGSHLCSDGRQRNSGGSVPLKIDVEFLPYFCQNNKFGCKEILFKDSELFEHERDCAFQIVCCPDFNCKDQVNFLNFLDHFKEKHDNHEDLGEGKTFNLPLLMDEIHTEALRVSLKNDALALKSPLQGMYRISHVVNGKPSWIMNSCAIWYYSSDIGRTSLHIGSKYHIGKNISHISAPNVTRGPDDSNNEWNYKNLKGDLVKAGGNDVMVQSLVEKGRY